MNKIKENIPEIDRIDITGSIRVDYKKVNGWKYKLSGSENGQAWEELVRDSGREIIGEEWVYVDFGASCTFDQIKLYWIR